MVNNEKIKSGEVQSFFSADDYAVRETAGNYEDEVDDDEINNTYLWISLTVFLTWILSFLIL